MTTTPTLRDAAQAVTIITTPDGGHRWIANSDEEVAHFSLPGQGHKIEVYTLAAPADALAEPVAWRERFSPTDFWAPCSKARHDDVLNRPHLWPHVEVQALVPAMTPCIDDASSTRRDVAQALEDAACVCDQLGRDWWELRKAATDQNTRHHLHSKVHGAEQCAAAIRAKGQQ